jgi:2-C-methyl-D-erythritol 2,4-cyclodiphosphate synthase
MIKVGVGQDSHCFDLKNDKILVLGGISIESKFGLKGNSDADVVIHSVCNAISSVTGVNILGKIADKMCKDGISDSSFYLKKALQHLNNANINHIAISIECVYPKLSEYIDKMKISIAKICNIDKSCVGITATTGESLTAFGQGSGIQAFSIITIDSKEK